MIKTITVPKSSSGNFTINDASCRLQRASGFGSPPGKITDENYPTDQGARFISQYYQKRRVVIGGSISKATVATFSAYRRELIDALSFLNDMKTILLTLDDDSLLQFDAVAKSKVRLYQGPGMLTYAKWEVELELFDPILYSQAEHSDTGYVTTIEGGADIPALVPIALTGGISNELSISNAGNARIWPSSFQIHGPGTNFVINNRTIDLAFNYDAEIPDGDYIDINFREKTALLNGLSNVYGNISGDFWHIDLGTNTITLQVGSGDGAGTRIEISWRDGYWGV